MLARRTRSARLVLAPLALATALVLGACGGSSEPADEASPTPTPEPTPDPVYSKLTGLDIKSEPGHSVFVVKIDNTRSSSPQTGLSSADLVTEEMVEGGVTRLAVFYDSTVPKVVGPVRSMRATDIGIVLPANAILVASGGAAQTVSRVRQADITTYTEGNKNFFRERSRRAPYNLMMNLADLVSSTDHTERPGAFLPFATDASAFPAGQPAPGMQVRFPSSRTNWEYDGSKYVNTNSYAAEDDQFYPATVLVLRVEVGDAGYRDPAGSRVPETKFTGTGEAMIFHGGQLVRGTWSKASLDAPLKLSTVAGEIKLPPGKIWMELLPKNGGRVDVDTPPTTAASPSPAQ